MKVQSANIKDQSQVKNSKPELKYRAFYFSLAIIRFIESLKHKQVSIRIIFEQLIRSVTSIGANIVEAKSSSSKREFLNYFQIALKSAQETKYWLALLKELLPNHRDKMIEFLKEAEDITKILSSSVLTMKNKRQL